MNTEIVSQEIRLLRKVIAVWIIELLYDKIVFVSAHKQRKKKK